MAKYLEENGLASVWSKIKSLINSHINNRNNPHHLTKSQIGLSNVDNTSDLNKPLSTATSAALGQKLNYRESFIGKADDVTSVGVCFLEAGTGNGSPDGKSAVTLYTRKGSGSNELWQSCRLGRSDYVRSKTAIGWSAWAEIPDFTTTLKSKLDGISAGANNYVHPTTSGNKHIPSGGKIGQWLRYTADGTAEWYDAYYAVDPDSKDPVQSKAVYSHLENFYAKKEDIAGTYKYKGSVADATKLPTTGQVTGDVYNIVAASVYGGPGANVAWDGTRWDSLGEIFQITSMTASDIDAICV